MHGRLDDAERVHFLAGRLLARVIIEGEPRTMNSSHYLVHDKYNVICNSIYLRCVSTNTRAHGDTRDRKWGKAYLPPWNRSNAQNLPRLHRASIVTTMGTFTKIKVYFEDDNERALFKQILQLFSRDEINFQKTLHSFVAASFDETKRKKGKVSFRGRYFEAWILLQSDPRGAFIVAVVAINSLSLLTLERERKYRFDWPRAYL